MCGDCMPPSVYKRVMHTMYAANIDTAAGVSDVDIAVACVMTDGCTVFVTDTQAGLWQESLCRVTLQNPKPSPLASMYYSY